MITEQEVMAYINEKTGKNEPLRTNSTKYVEKLKALDEILKTQTASLNEMRAKTDALELDIQRSKGAVSILLELVAEEEGLLASTENPENPNNSNTTTE